MMDYGDWHGFGYTSIPTDGTAQFPGATSGSAKSADAVQALYVQDAALAHNNKAATDLLWSLSTQQKTTAAPTAPPAPYAPPQAPVGLAPAPKGRKGRKGRKRPGKGRKRPFYRQWWFAPAVIGGAGLVLVLVVGVSTRRS